MKKFSYYKSRANIFLLAIILWLFVVTGREYEITCEVPLVVENVREGKVLVSEVPEMVEVAFKGTGRSLIYMQTFDNAKIHLDISTIRYFYDFPILPSLVKYPSSLQVTPVKILRPDTVMIRLEEKVERSLPIVPMVTLEPAPGFVIVGEITTVPVEVMVSGPSSIMEDLNFIATSSLELSDIKTDFEMEIALAQPDGNLELAVDAATVKASLERLTENFIRNIPVRVVNVPDHLSVVAEPAVLTVKIRGPVSVVKNLGSEQISASIAFPAGWEGGNNAFEPVVTTPDEVELVDFQPDTVFLTLIEE